jgi:hypothetical protein
VILLPHLVQRPLRAEVPPLGRVEEVVEPGGLEPDHVFHRRSQRLREEHGLAVDGLRLADQEAPQLRRHLVRRVAAKALEAQVDGLADELRPVPPEPLAVVRGQVVDFCEVAPDGAVAGVGIDGVGALHRAVLPDEPAGVLLDERRVPGGVVDHQVHHRLHPHLPDLAQGVAQRLQRRGIGAGGKEHGVQPAEVLDRVQASRKAGVVPRVQVQPLELHLPRAPGVLRPPRGGADEPLKEVVDEGRPHTDSGKRIRMPRFWRAKAGHPVRRVDFSVGAQGTCPPRARRGASFEMTDPGAAIGLTRGLPGWRGSPPPAPTASRGGCSSHSPSRTRPSPARTPPARAPARRGPRG